MTKTTEKAPRGLPPSPPLSLSLSLLYVVLFPVVQREEDGLLCGGRRPNGERALDNQTHRWSPHLSTRARSRRWERGRRNSGQFSPATALTIREPRTHFLSIDLRDLERPSLSRPFITPYYEPVQDTRAARNGRRVLHLLTARTSINPCVFLHHHPPLNAHPRESLAGAKKTPTPMYEPNVKFCSAKKYIYVFKYQRPRSSCCSSNTRDFNSLVSPETISQTNLWSIFWK